MLKVEDLLGNFSRIFNFFGFWPPEALSKAHKRALVAAFVIFIIGPIILIAASVAKAKAIDEVVISMFYLIGYSYVFSAIGVIWYHRETLEDLMANMAVYFYEDDLALPFVTAAIRRSKLLSTFIMIWTTFVLNFGVILVPVFLNILPIPMLIPKFPNEGWTFGIFWILQIFSVNYTIGNVAIFVYMCVLLILINGYAEYLCFKLRILIWSKEYSGYLELVDCIQVHRKLKEMMSSFSLVFGTIHGIFLKVMEFLVAVCMFAILQDKNNEKTFMFCGYILALESLIFIPCYFGGKIYSTSSEFVSDLFACEWNDADLKYKKMINIFMENLKHPVTLNVLLHPKLNLENFTSNLNAAYSLFSIMKNLNNSLN